MAHSTLHFSLGMVAGSALTLPALLAAWRRGRPLAMKFLRWLTLSWALGALAVVPGFLGRMGVPSHVCDAWWMNVFLFYPLLNALKKGGDTMGPIILSACFAGQYLLLLSALYARTRRRPPPSAQEQTNAENPVRRQH